METYQLHEVARDRLCGCAKVTRSVSSWFSYRILATLCAAEAVCGATLGGRQEVRLQEMQNKRTKKNSSMLSKSPKSDFFKKFPFLIRPVPQWYINNCVKQGILHMQPDCRLASSMQRLRLCTRAMHFQKHLRRLLPGLQRPWRVVHPKEKPRRTFFSTVMHGGNPCRRCNSR